MDTLPLPRRANVRSTCVCWYAAAHLGVAPRTLPPLLSQQTPAYKQEVVIVSMRPEPTQRRWVVASHGSELEPTLNTNGATSSEQESWLGSHR